MLHLRKRTGPTGYQSWRAMWLAIRKCVDGYPKQATSHLLSGNARRAIPGCCADELVRFADGLRALVLEVLAQSKRLDNDPVNFSVGRRGLLELRGDSSVTIALSDASGSTHLNPCLTPSRASLSCVRPVELPEQALDQRVRPLVPIWLVAVPAPGNGARAERVLVGLIDRHTRNVGHGDQP